MSRLEHRYENACFAELKARGDFPYLSRPEEASLLIKQVVSQQVTLFVEVHMRRFGAGAFRKRS